MNGRVYDPNLGRFLSVDPVFQFPTNTQSLNPYSYVLNNPLSLTDPTGYTSACPTGQTCPDDSGLKAGDTAHISYTPTGSHIATTVTATVQKDGSVAITSNSPAVAKGIAAAADKMFGGGNGATNAQGAGDVMRGGGEDATSQTTTTKVATINNSAGGQNAVTATDAQKQAFANVKLSDVQGSDSGLETKFFLNSDMKLLGKTQSGCDGQDHCLIYASELPQGTDLIGHTHVYDPDNSVSGMRTQSQKVADLSRDIPGPGDASPLQLGKIGGVITPGGYHYMFDGTPGAPQVHYVGGGRDPVFGNYAAQRWQNMQWVQGQENDQVKGIASDYLRGPPQ